MTGDNGTRQLFINEWKSSLDVPSFHANINFDFLNLYSLKINVLVLASDTSCAVL